MTLGSGVPTAAALQRLSGEKTAGRSTGTHSPQSPDAMIRSRQPASQRAGSASSTGTSATLSIVVVSNGSAEVCLSAMRALESVVTAGVAQVVFVHRGEREAAALASFRHHGVVTVNAAAGCSRAEMCDRAMRHVSGTIVTVREATDVGTASWLSAFETLIPALADRHQAAAPAMAVGERVVLDTMKPRVAPVEGRPEPLPRLTDLALPAARGEMAATL